MNLAELTIPEVQAMQQSARFYREGNQDFIEISYVGSKDTLVRKVQPEHMSRFRLEWNAYCDGTPLSRRKGTPLTDIPGVDEKRAEQFIQQNVHNAEELAVLSDGQCQALGHGTLTARASAQKIIMQRKFEAREKAHKAVIDSAATIGPKPAEKYASQSDLSAVNEKLDALMAMMAGNSADKRKPGRPKKDKTIEPS